MNRFLKRTLSMILAVLMIFGSTPQIVSAMMLEETAVCEEENCEEHSHEENIAEMEENIPDSEEGGISWEQGTIASADGTNNNAKSRFRTADYLKLESYSGVSINEGYTMTNFVYDENHNYLGTSSWIGEGIPFKTSELMEKYPAGVYFRVVFRAADQRNLTEEDITASGVKFYLAGEEVPEPDLGFTFENLGSIGTWQDGDIHDGKLFVFGAAGTGVVFDIETLEKLGGITLDKKDVIKPHANSVCFGSTYYEKGDKYPLLYINIYNNYSSSADRMEGTCCVYRVLETEGNFSTELVQVIKIGFTEDLTLWKSKENNGDVRPYGNFVVDTDKNSLYAFVMRDANKTTRYFEFEIPEIGAGTFDENYGCNVVTLETDDIKNQFDSECYSYLQGCCYYGGKILYMGDFGGDAPLYLVDLESRKITENFNLGYAGLKAEPEVICVDDSEGNLYYCVADGILRELELSTEFEENIPDSGEVCDHTYSNGICTICKYEPSPVLIITDLVNGTYASNALTSTPKTRLRHDPIPVKAGDQCSFSLPDGWSGYICLAYRDKNWNYTPKAWVQEYSYTFQSDLDAFVVVRKDDGSVISPEEFTGEIVFTRKEANPDGSTSFLSYYQEEVDRTVESVKALIGDEPCLVFPMVSDIHYLESSEVPNSFDFCVANLKEIAKEIDFDFIACLGDITEGDTTQEVTSARNEHIVNTFTQLGVPYYQVIGNHDDNRYGDAIFTNEQLYENYLSTITDVVFDTSSMHKTNYYKDFDELGVRCIFLNANTNGAYGYSEETCNWFEEAIKTENKLIVFTHIPPIPEQNYGAKYGTDSGSTRIREACENADNFLIMFSGHNHYDLAITEPFLSFTMNCQKFENENGDPNLWAEGAVKPERVAGTATEDCFDIVVVRPESGQIDLVRFGAGEDRSFQVEATHTHTYSTLSEAALALREKMIARESPVTIRVAEGISASEVLAKAWEHNGTPNEGDYIRHNQIRHSYETVSGEDENGAYNEITYTFNWLTTAEQEAEVDAAVDALLAELDLWDKTDYEKIKGAYDWITENVEYDSNNYDNDDSVIEHSTYAAIILKEAVCQGYATLYYRLMLELGVDCRYIKGMAGYVEVESHAWNIVALEGKYYNMDATWDRDLMGHYRMFLCTEANFTEHIPDSEYTTAEWKAKYPMAVVPYVFNAAASGKLPNGIEWVLDGDTGTLTVAGNGAIPNYRYDHAPWYDYKDSVKAIVVSEGITEVGERAFYWCINCTSLTLPESLVAIREYGFNNLRSLEYVTLPGNLKIMEFCAFSECVALKEIVIPDSVTTCGTSVFSNCYGLQSAVIGNGIKQIPSGMFFGDKNLRNVTLPEGLTYIDDTAFADCGLYKITLPATLTGLGTSVFAGCRNMYDILVEEGNQYYKSINGVLFTKDGKTLVSYPAGDVGSYYYVPEGTVTIARSAFNDAYRLQYVYFPDSLREIKPYAFAYCNALWSVTFTPNITRIGDSAFRSCKGLYSVIFENQDVILESAVFADCDYLQVIYLPRNLKEIPSYLFDDCAKLSEIEIPKTVTKIGSCAFSDCDSLVSITVPGNVKSIGQQTFDFCDKLETIVFEEGLQKIGWLAIRNNPKLKKVVIPSSVTTFERPSNTSDKTFDKCPNVVVYVNCGTAGWNYVRNYSISYSASHPYTNQTTVPPTCTEQGYTRYYCSCGTYSYKSSYTSALGHSYTSAVTAPTCTEEGFTTYTCTRCGYSYTGNYVPENGHSIITEGYIAPTCTEPGYSGDQYCKNCDYRVKGEEIPAEGHLYNIHETLPTCTGQGYTTYTCSVCGDSYIDDYVPASGHTEGEAVVENEVPATCGKDGSHDEVVYCKVCGEELRRKTIVDKATGDHVYSTEKERVEPTCTEDGYVIMSCGCGAEQKTVLKALGHDEVTDAAKAPTCTETGLTEGKHCGRCGTVLVKQEVVPALGHDYVSGVCTKCGETKKPYQRITYFTVEVESENGKTYTDNAVLYLPKNYSINGEPVKLIIYCKQGSSAITGSSNPIESVGFYNYLLNLGYAILGVDGVPDAWRDELGLDNTRVVGNPIAVQGTEKAYNYVIEHYNIASDGCFISGYSQGGHYAQNVIDLTDIPILAAAEQSPVCSMRYHQWDLNATVTVNSVKFTKGARLNVARIYGFPKVTTNAELLALEYNPELVADYDPWVRNSENVYTGFVQKGNLWYLPEGTSVDDIEMTHSAECPVKIWCAEDDTAVSADVMKVFVKAIQNDGGIAEISVAKNGGHGFFQNQASVGSFTENGKTYKTLPIAIEIADWFARFGGYERTHNYNSVVTEPTCTGQGYTTYTCSVCGDSYIDDYVPASGHTEGEWYTVTEATPTEPGEECRDCGKCEHYETRVTKPLGYYSAKAEILSDGESLVLTERNIVMTNKHMLFSGRVESIGEGAIRLGHGKGSYYTEYIEITAEKLNVYIQNSSVEVKQYSHGLKIEGNVEVSIDVDSLGKGTIVITTDSGKYTRTVGWSGGRTGKIFCEAEGTAIENADCRWWCDGFSEDVWFFGDSYFSISDGSRWTYYMVKDGHTTNLLAGYGGMGAADGLAQFKEFIKFEKPAYVIWCLGMNNGDRNNTINQSWLTSTEEFIRICEENGIVPILSTIPTTPTINNRLKNEWVENSGYRYIDFDLAVVGNHSTGEWLEGMLSSDNCHPAKSGAEALYRQFIADFSEIGSGDYENCIHKILEMGERIPDCEHKGRQNYWVCSLCGGAFTDADASYGTTTEEMILEPTGHTLGEWYTVTEATPTEPGEERRDCGKCDYSETREIPLKGYELGDVNLDGKVDVMDSYYIRLVVAKLRKPTEQQILLGDVDLDGKLTAIDANIIRKYAVKMIETLPVQ